MRHNKGFITTVKSIAETMTRSPEKEVEAIAEMISKGNFMTAAQGMKIGRAISEGFTKGLGVNKNGG